MLKNIILYCKYTVSTILVIYSIVIILYGILHNYNIVAMGKPVSEIFILLFSFITLAANEGYQVAALQIQHMEETDPNLLLHPRVLKIHKLLFSNESKLKNLMIGQSFFVFLCTFIISKLTTLTYFPISIDKSGFIFTVLFASGLSGIILCINIAQLFPSIFAQKHPILFLNLPGMIYLIKFALFIESTGIFQFVYLYINVLKIYHREEKSQEIIESSNETKFATNTILATNYLDHQFSFQQVVNMVKYSGSTFVTLLALGFLIFGISMGYGSVNAPNFVQIILFIGGLLLIFYCEGLKVALLASQNISASTCRELSFHRASKTKHLLESMPELMKRFLLGRQLIVVPVSFLIAQITNFSKFPSNIFNDFFYGLFVDVGLPGILVVMIFAQLSGQILGECRRLSFLDMRGCYCLTRVAIELESLGITTFAWILQDTLHYLLFGRNERDYDTWKSNFSDDSFDLQINENNEKLENVSVNKYVDSCNVQDHDSLLKVSPTNIQF